jgi:hypothetical protein
MGIAMPNTCHRLPSRRGAIAAVGTTVAVLGLQGCAIVASQRAGGSAEGVAYMLPKALLPVTLTDRDGAFDLSIAEPVLIGDSAHTYVLQRSGNVFTSDNVTIHVDPKTGLLTKVDVKSTDQTLATVIELLKGKSLPEAADASTAVVVFRGLLDPGASAPQLDAFNRAINAAVVAHLPRSTACASAPTGEPCRSLQSLVAAAPFTIRVDGFEGDAPKAAGADCTAGVCYRLNVPHLVTLSGPGISNSAVFGLPNRSPTFALPLERWAFVRTTHDVALDGGVFKSITTDRPSSALAAAAAPVQAASAVLGAVAQVVQLKVDLSGKEKALADARVAEINAKAALDKKLLEGGSSGDAEAAILGNTATRSTQTLLSISVGQARSNDALSNLQRGGGRFGTRTGSVPTPPAAAASAPTTGGRTSGGSSGGLGR